MLDYIQNNIFTAIPTTTFSVEILFAHKSTMADSSNPTATNNELEPLEFLDHIRETLKGRISDDSDDEKVHNCNIEQNIREIRALLAINDEISKRCMTNVKSTGDKTTLTLFGYYSVKTMQNGTNLELLPNHSGSKKHLTPCYSQRFRQAWVIRLCPSTRKIHHFKLSSIMTTFLKVL